MYVFCVLVVLCVLRLVHRSWAGFCGQLEVLHFTYLQLIYDQASAEKLSGCLYTRCQIVSTFVSSMAEPLYLFLLFFVLVCQAAAFSNNFYNSSSFLKDSSATAALLPSYLLLPPSGFTLTTVFTWASVFLQRQPLHWAPAYPQLSHHPSLFSVYNKYTLFHFIFIYYVGVHFWVLLQPNRNK